MNLRTANILAAGTSEGAVKGWENRVHGLGNTDHGSEHASGTYENAKERFPDVDQFMSKAGDTGQLGRIKKALIKLMDDDATKISDGVLLALHKFHGDRLRQMNYTPQSSEDARVDRILRIRDSTGRAKARK